MISNFSISLILISLFQFLSQPNFTVKSSIFSLTNHPVRTPSIRRIADENYANINHVESIFNFDDQIFESFTFPRVYNSFNNSTRLVNTYPAEENAVTAAFPLFAAQRVGAGEAEIQSQSRPGAYHLGRPNNRHHPVTDARAAPLAYAQPIPSTSKINRILAKIRRFLNRNANQYPGIVEAEFILEVQLEALAQAEGEESAYIYVSATIAEG